MKAIIATFCLLTISSTVYAAKKAPDACKKAMVALQRSEAIDSYKAVENACNSLVEPLCETRIAQIEGLSGGDAELVLTGCALRTAYVANVTIGNGHATPRCQEAVMHIYTPSLSKAASSAATCVAENQRVCGGAASDLEKSKCQAKAAYASYVEAQNSKGLKLDSATEKAAQATSNADSAEYLKELLGH